MRSRLFAAVLLVGLWAVGPACSGGSPQGPAQVDNDDDKLPDDTEDRNGNGQVDPGETDPNSNDTDGDGIPDGEEVSTLACDPSNDRPFAVLDVPGADAEVLVDAQVSVRGLVRTNDDRNPGAVFHDPGLDVAAAILGKGAQGGSLSNQRAQLMDGFAALGNPGSPRVRTFVTTQGFPAEQARFPFRADQAMNGPALVNALSSAALGGVALQDTLPEVGAESRDFTLSMLTIQRSANTVVFLFAATPGAEISDAARIRQEELTDGTNVARRGSFTRHVCDPFVAEAKAYADILWVVDDSGSMADDQMAVRAAAGAMAEVLEAAQVDFRLAVARMYANRPENDQRRGRLEGDGFTSDLNKFQEDILVGADGGWEPGLQTGLDALNRALPATAPGAAADPQRLRGDAATIVIHLSDERDQHVECAACGGCEAAEGEARSCTRPQGQVVTDEFIGQYQAMGAVTFAIVGDLPDGCSQGVGRDDFEPGQGYVEVAAATGGQFGSLCGDMRQNLQDVARVATGVSSTYALSAKPASATLRVAIGLPGHGRVVPRSGVNGFDYDPVQNTIVFFGDARPAEGEEVVVAYRRWDWANNPDTPNDPCDDCVEGSWCNPEADRAMCEEPCGEVLCEGELVCLPDTARCGEESELPTETPCGECDPGLVCNPGTLECVVPCEETGCEAGELCNSSTHLCQPFSP
ncbi:MAG: hypothetical protein H6730_13830 [Deltaproteobacteria bacterium]|nr:hypothetical protein [Deltaproteobacteria bacterium]